MALTELAEDYGMDLAESDVVTVAGLVLSKRGVAPKQGAMSRASAFVSPWRRRQGSRSRGFGRDPRMPASVENLKYVCLRFLSQIAERPDPFW